MNNQDKILIYNECIKYFEQRAEYCRTLNAFLKLKIY